MKKNVIIAVLSIYCFLASVTSYSLIDQLDYQIRLTEAYKSQDKKESGDCDHTDCCRKMVGQMLKPVIPQNPANDFVVIDYIHGPNGTYVLSSIDYGSGWGPGLWSFYPY